MDEVPRRGGPPAALTVFAAVMGAVYVCASVAIVRYGGLVKDLGWEYRSGPDGWRVAAVDPEGPAFGKLQAGDSIAAIEGDRAPAYGLLWAGLRRIEPGVPYTLRVAGSEGERDLSLTASLVARPHLLGRSVLFLLCGLSYLLVGVAVLALRPDRAIARLLALWFLFGALGMLSQALVSARGHLHGAVLGIYLASQYAVVITFALGFAFYHRFPDGRSKSRVTLHVERFLGGWAALLVASFAILQASALPSAHRPFPVQPGFFLFARSFNAAYQGFIVTALLAACASLTRAYLLEREPQSRRRLKWVVYGSLLGFLPLLTAVLTELGRLVSAGGGSGHHWIDLTSISLLVVVPVSFGYAVVKDRLFDVEVVVRRGVQYLLARNALRAFVFVPLGAIAVTLYRSRELPLTEIAVRNSPILYALAAAALALRYGGPLSAAIDRRFFREAYDRERVLAGVADRIRQLDADRPGRLPDVVALVKSEVDAVLHPERIDLVFRTGESGLDAAELSGFDLVVPVVSSARRLHGFLLLGARRSETPYTATDRRLLEAIAEQVAVAYETFLLREQKDRLAEKVIELEASERRAQEAREEAFVANRAKSVFLASMSHELRSPLNAVLGFAELLERSRSMGEEDRASLRIIQSSGEHLLGLIDDVLSIAKIEAGKVSLAERPFALGDLLEGLREIVRAPAEAKELELLFDVDASARRVVVGDEGKLRQVLLNLLGNAVKFTERGRVTLRARFDSGRALFEVEDTGRGITAEELSHLFQAFVQTESGRESKEGTGLGLYISRRMVRLMGGDLHVTSRPGEGSLFRVDVALAAAVGAGAAMPAKPRPRRAVGLVPSSSGRAPRLLVADDLVENRLLMTKLLAPVGFEVREAANGQEVVREWQAWRPDLIWMDVRMPVMDGRAATRAIRRLETGGPAPPVRIVALTASALEHERDEILACGADDLVTKPFREEKILETLAEQLGCGFVYEDDASSEGEAEAKEAGFASPLTPERVAALPERYAREIYQSLVTGDFARSAELADGLREQDDALGRALGDEIRAFRSDQLLPLFAPRPR